MILSEQIKERIKLYLVLFKGQNIIITIISGIILSILFFQENQVIGGIIVLFLVHFDRKDLIFCQIAYSENYKKIIIIEYLTIYSLFVLAAIFLKDPLLIYAPLFFFISLIFVNYSSNTIFKNRNRFNKINLFILSNNYEWKVGVHKNRLKIILITVAFSLAIVFSKIVYLYNIYLFLILLIVKDFYIPKEPKIFLEFRGNTKKRIIISTIKMHFKTFTITILPVTFVQLFIFYNDILIVYSLTGLISAYFLIFFFTTYKYKNFEIDNSIQLTKLKNGFLSSATILPPLTLFIGAISFIWLNEIKNND